MIPFGNYLLAGFLEVLLRLMNISHFSQTLSLLYCHWLTLHVVLVCKRLSAPFNRFRVFFTLKVERLKLMVPHQKIVTPRVITYRCYTDLVMRFPRIGTMMPFQIMHIRRRPFCSRFNLQFQIHALLIAHWMMITYRVPFSCVFLFRGSKILLHIFLALENILLAKSSSSVKS